MPPGRRINDRRMTTIDTLRLILLAVGIVIIAVVYITGKRDQRRREEHKPTRSLRKVENMPMTVTDTEPHAAEPKLPNVNAWIAERRKPPVREPILRTVTPVRKADTEAVPPVRKADVETVTPMRKADAEALPDTNDHARAAVNKPVAQGVQRLVVLHITAREESVFSGADILRAVERTGLSFGKMNIFHRYLGAEALDIPLFSLANAVEPGDFSLSALDETNTPGLTLFMHLPGPLPADAAIDMMLETARHLAEQLDGDVRNQERKILTDLLAQRLRGNIMRQASAPESFPAP